MKAIHLIDILLIVLLLSNLNVINWQSGAPKLEAERTRQNIVNAIGGSIHPELEEDGEATEEDW